jgi:hypothetical protein
MTAGLLCALVAGCYSYRPLPSVDAAMPAAGSQVEVRLTTAGASALANQLGPDMLFVEGALISADDAGLTLAVNRTETARKIGADWKGEHVTLPKESVASVGERKFSVGATALLGGLAGGGLVAAYALLNGSGNTSGIVVPPGSGHQ